MLIKKYSKINLRLALAVTAIAGLGFEDYANAGAAKKIYSPYVEAGELEVEARSGVDFDNNADKDGAMQHKLAVGYGITQRWAAEVYAEWEKEGEDGSDTNFTAASIENRYQLFERGEYFADAGLYFEYEKSFVKNGADKIEGKLLLEKDFGKIANVANIILEKEIGENAQKRLEGGLALSSRYLYNEMFEPGVEFYSDFGELSKTKPYKNQNHQLGPVFYGKLPWHVKYEVGYLFGISKAAPDGELKTILEYEVNF